MMLWPEARRSPRVGIAGATPTPSADTHATARSVAASSRRCRKLRQRPRGGDNRQSVRGHPGEGVGQHLDGVTVQQQRRIHRRQRQLRVEPGDPLSLIGPQAGAQPSGVIGVGHVEGIEIDADPGDDLGHRPRRDGPVAHDRTRQLHRGCRVAQRLSVAVGDANAIDIEIEPSRTAHVDQPNRIRAHPARRLGNGWIQHGAASGLVGQRPPAHGDGHDRVGHCQQRVDRRAGGSLAVRGDIGRGKRWGTSGEGEVVQRGEDHRRVPLAGRRRLDGAQRLIGLTQGDGDPLVQRRCFGGVHRTEMPINLSECASPQPSNLPSACRA